MTRYWPVALILASLLVSTIIVNGAVASSFDAKLMGNALAAVQGPSSADGVVTMRELSTASQAYATCLDALGIESEIEFDVHNMGLKYLHSVPEGFASSDVLSSDAGRHCYTRHIGGLDFLWADQHTADDLDALRSNVKECMSLSIGANVGLAEQYNVRRETLLSCVEAAYAANVQPTPRP